MFKKIIPMALVFAIVLSMFVPFASASGGETKSVQFYNYNGVVMPDINEIWDKETFPYAVVVIGDTYSSYAHIYFISSPVYCKTTSNNALYNLDTVSYCRYSYYFDETTYIVNGEVQYSGGDVKTVSANSLAITTSRGSVWSNFDVYGSNDDVIYFPASEPVIDKLVEYELNPQPAAPLYDYGGVILPDIKSSSSYDASCRPYMLIYKLLGMYYFETSSVPFVYNSEKGYIYTADACQRAYSRVHENQLLNGYGWYYSSDILNVSSSRQIAAFKNLLWTNHDIVDYDGVVVFTSVPAVPLEPMGTFVDNTTTIVGHSLNWVDALSKAIIETPFVLAFVLVAFAGVSIRIICRLKNR